MRQLETRPEFVMRNAETRSGSDRDDFREVRPFFLPFEARAGRLGGDLSGTLCGCCCLGRLGCLRLFYFGSSGKRFGSFVNRLNLHSKNLAKIHADKGSIRAREDFCRMKMELVPCPPRKRFSTPFCHGA